MVKAKEVGVGRRKAKKTPKKNKHPPRWVDVGGEKK
jgi:hypothetical protein